MEIDNLTALENDLVSSLTANTANNWDVSVRSGLSAKYIHRFLRAPLGTITYINYLVYMSA